MNLAELLTHPYTIVIARWMLAGILLIAGITKLFDREGFIQAVELYRVLPARLTRVFALCLPYLEVISGFGLLVGLWTRAATMLAIALFVSFAIAIAINVARGKDLDCHCFGKLRQEKTSPVSLFRNFVFALLAIHVSIFADGYLAVDGWLLGTNAKGDSPPIAGLLPIGLVTLAGLIVYMLIHQTWIMIHTKGS